MKSVVFFIIILTLLNLSAYGDWPGGIRGAVTDLATMKPLQGANILIDGIDRGAVSDSSGAYIITNISPGVYDITVSHVGYGKKIIEGVIIKSGEVQVIDVELQEVAIPFEAVLITGLITRQPDDDPVPGITYLQPASVKSTPGALEDVFRTVQALPGVQTRSDIGAHFSIRGASPGYNLYIIDGIEIFNPYRMYGLITGFNPELISSIELYTGGFPVRYSDRLSSVLDIKYREGKSDKPIAGSIDATITNASVIVEGAMPLGIRGSWIVSGRRTYYDLLAGLVLPEADEEESLELKLPYFSDLYSKISLNPGHNQNVQIKMLRGWGGTLLRNNSIDNVNEEVRIYDENSHTLYGFTWRYFPDENIMVNTIASWYGYHSRSGISGRMIEEDDEPPAEFDIYSGIKLTKTSVTSNIDYNTGNRSILTGVGVDFISSNFERIFDLPFDGPLYFTDLRLASFLPTDDIFKDLEYTRSYFYTQYRWNPAMRLIVQPGLRFDYYSIIPGFYFSPRLNISYALDDRSTIRTGVGRFLQSPGYEKFMWQHIPFSRPEMDFIPGQRLHPEEAYHFVMGIDRWVSDATYVKVESYYKLFLNLLKPVIVPGTEYTSDPVPGEDGNYIHGWTFPYRVESDSLTDLPSNDGWGYSYGIEIFVEKKQRYADERLSGWLSYSYGIANEYYHGIITPALFDRRHNLNVALNYRISGKFHLGVRWNYGSGFPYTPAVGIKPRIRMMKGEEENIPEIETIGESGRVILDPDFGDTMNRNSARLPPYSRIDLRVNWSASIFGLESDFYVDIINLFNRENIITYNYTINDELEPEPSPALLLPFIPTFGISVRF